MLFVSCSIAVRGKKTQTHKNGKYMKSGKRRRRGNPGNDTKIYDFPESSVDLLCPPGPLRSTFLRDGAKNGLLEVWAQFLSEARRVPYHGLYLRVLLGATSVSTATPARWGCCFLRAKSVRLLGRTCQAGMDDWRWMHHCAGTGPFGA